MEFCNRKNENLEERFARRAESYNKINKTVTQFDFRNIIESMEVTLTDFEMRNIKRILDKGGDSGFLSLKPFYDIKVSAGAMGNSLLLNSMKDTLPSLDTEEEERLLQAALRVSFLRKLNIQLKTLSFAASI